MAEDNAKAPSTNIYAPKKITSTASVAIGQNSAATPKSTLTAPRKTTSHQCSAARSIMRIVDPVLRIYDPGFGAGSAGAHE